MRKTWMLAVLLAGAIAAPAFADHERHREERHERHEERHEERRRDDRREERHEEHRDVERREERRWLRDRPPAIRVERHEPRRGYTWVNGRYDVLNGRYEWVGGRYERERVGYRWREPRYEVRDGVYVAFDGGWDSLGPVVAPPSLREERWESRRGYVFVRGSWGWRDGGWAWTPGHYEVERVGYRYREPRWEQREGVYVNLGGTWEVGN